MKTLIAIVLFALCAGSLNARPDGPTPSKSPQPTAVQQPARELETPQPMPILLLPNPARADSLVVVTPSHNFTPLYVIAGIALVASIVLWVIALGRAS